MVFRAFGLSTYTPVTIFKVQIQANYFRITLIVILLVWGSTTVYSQNRTIEISKEALKSYTIVVYNDSSAVQRKAAKELQHYLNLIYQIKLEIKAEGQITGEGHYFLLGEGFINDSLNLIDTLTKDAFIKSFHNGNIYLGGKDDLDVQSVKKAFFTKKEEANFGTLYATYDFLETELGVHWFFPTYLGEFVPKTNYLELKEKTITDIPDFIERDFGIKFLYYNDDTAMTWLIRNRAGVPNLKRYNHNWRKIIPPSKYFDSLPEIFALINDSRLPKVNGKYAPLCTTNEQLINLFKERSLEYLRTHPGVSFLSISPNDGRRNCECENCLSSDTCEHLDDFDQYSCRIFSFYKRISDSIWRYFPDVEVGGYAYQSYLRNTKEINLPENFHIRLAVNNYGLNNDKCESYSILSSLISSWKEKENKGFFSFPYGNSWVYPYIQTELYKELISELKENHFQKAVFFMLPDWYNQGLDIWIMTKLLWNVDVDIDSLKTVYYNAVYPESQTAIQYFHQELQKKIESADFCVTKFLLPKKNITREMFLSIFSEDMLKTTLNKIEFQLNKKDSLLPKERQNLLNFKSLITFLQIEYDSYYWYSIFRLRPGNEETEEYVKTVNKLQFSVCLSGRSRYFNSQISPSLFIKQYLLYRKMNSLKN